MRRRDLLWLGGVLGLFAVERRTQAQQGPADALLNLRLDAETLGRLWIWDERNTEWRRARPDENPAAGPPVLVLHVWADWCKPCKEEFPVLRDLDAHFAGSAPKKVRFIYVAAIPNSPEMEQFLKDHRAAVPRGPHYQDTAEHLSRVLRPQLQGKRLPLPLTLVLDERRIVRFAHAGSLLGNLHALTKTLDLLIEQAGSR